MSRSLPGFSAPAASFDQPFEMMEACHDRVQRSHMILVDETYTPKDGQSFVAIQHGADIMPTTTQC